MPHPPGQEARVAYLRGIVAARLFFSEVVRVIVPMTGWWRERKIAEQVLQVHPTSRPRRSPR